MGKVFQTLILQWKIFQLFQIKKSCWKPEAPINIQFKNINRGGKVKVFIYSREVIEKLFPQYFTELIKKYEL